MTMPTSDPREQFAAFIAALFQPDDIVEVRAIDCRDLPDGTDKLLPTQSWGLAKNLHQTFPSLAASNAEGRAIYVGANPRFKKGGSKAEDVALARSFFVDFDGGVTSDQALTRIAAAGLPTPSIVVASGHGVHCYWRFSEPMTDLALWTRYQKSLIALLDTDKAINDRARIMRAPGFLNNKREPHIPATLVSATDARYGLEQFPEPARQQPAAPPSGTKTPSTAARVAGMGNHAKLGRENLSRATLYFLQFGAVQPNRNNALISAACDYHGNEIPREQADRELGDVARRCGLPDDEISATIESAYSKVRSPARPVGSPVPRDASDGADSSPTASAPPSGSSVSASGGGGPESWPPPKPLNEGAVPPPFPNETAFPESLSDIRAFVTAVAEQLQVPLDLPAMAILPIAAVAIAKKFEIEIRPGWRETPALWTLTLLKSGERKSGTFTIMSKPILEWERDEGVRLASTIAEGQEQRRIAESRLLAARKKAAKSPKGSDAENHAIELAKELAEMPLLKVPEIFTSEATTEGLAKILVENNERGIVASAEADALDVMMGRYSERNTPNMGIWLKGHAGDPEKIVRRSRPTEFLARPVLCVAIVVQPEAVRGLYASRAARGRGLLARFFVSLPASMLGHRKTGGAAEPIPDWLEERYHHLVRALLDLPIDLAGVTFVTLDPEATELFYAFEAQIESQLGPHGSLGERTDWGGKMCGAVGRIALVLYALQWAKGDSSGGCGSSAHVIDAAIMRAALSWVPYLAEHERIVAGVAGCDRDTAIAEKLLAWLRRTGLETFTRRDAFSLNRFALLQAVEDIDGALEMLEDLGYIRKLPEQGSSSLGGRKKSASYAVNPNWDRGGDA